MGKKSVILLSLISCCFSMIIAQILPVNRLTHDNSVRHREKDIIIREFKMNILNPYAENTSYLYKPDISYSEIPEIIDNEKLYEYVITKAKRGDKYAQYACGEMLLNGIGCEVNYKEANKWLVKAAKQGDALAQCALGYNYFEGIGTKKDYKKAKSYFEKAAKEDIPEAQYNLYIIYSNGYGGVINNDLAQAYLFKSAQYDIPIAQFELAEIYYNGYLQSSILGYGGSPAKVVTQPLEADYIINHPKKDHSDSQLLANMYFCQDNDYIKESLKYLEKSAEGGESMALNMLGLMYYHGDGVKKDISKAVEYFQKGAFQNNSEALYNLAWCYYKGEGVEKDLIKATELFEKASSLGNISATKLLERIN